MLAADAWIFATPIYNGHMSSSMSALLERLYFSHCNYDAHERMVEREYHSVLIYSMNGNQQFMSQMGIENSCKYMVANSTLQFDDYSKYHTAAVPVELKTKLSAELFPQDLNRAYELGKGFATPHES